MTRLIAPIVIATSTAGADIGVRYLEGQPVGMASAAAIAAFVGGACIWLERRLTRIETKFDDLPCQTNGCPKKDKKGKYR